jgi:hypothetical protein
MCPGGLLDFSRYSWAPDLAVPVAWAAHLPTPVAAMYQARRNRPRSVVRTGTSTSSAKKRASVAYPGALAFASPFLLARS